MMKRVRMNSTTDGSVTSDKTNKPSLACQLPITLIRNDLETFCEQSPTVATAAIEVYQTKPLPYCASEYEEIVNTFRHALPIEYRSWENEVVRRSSSINPTKSDEAGWIPSRECRTMAAYQKEISGRNVDYLENTRFDDRDRVIHWYSVFPLDDAVILKNLADNADFPIDLNCKPKYNHPQQDTTVTELPIEPVTTPVRKERASSHKKMNMFKHSKESRLHRTRNVLARVGLSGVLPDNYDEFYRHHEKYKEPVKPKSVSFWNLSNDNYYDCSGEHDFLSKRRMNSSQNLDFLFYPIFRTVSELRHFHRPSLYSRTRRHYWTPIQSVHRQMFDQSARMKSDLTGRFGELLLFEYSEQYPALLNESGMFSKIRTYLRPQHFKANMSSLEVDYGEMIYTHASPFLWSIPRGLNVQTLENNMFITPIYRQTPLSNDFLIIWDRKGDLYIRNVDAIYITGQQCPLIEVPIPQSKRVNLFQRDLLQIYIYRLFLQSHETPRRIRIEDIKRVFPRLAESSIRKRLKTSADFRRTDDCNSWILRNDFRLPTEDEICDLVKPEFCCAYASMTAAEQLLKDAGLCEKYSIGLDDDDGQSSHLSELNDEILQAPWNTTRAYLGALRGKCSMQAVGIGAKSIHKNKTNHELKHLRRAVTGTDADLRRLQLKDARKLLLKFNVSEKIIQSLTRWEIVDLVRTLSTQQAKEGTSGGMIKFARGAKHYQAQQFEKYKENCQKQFELQNRLFTCGEDPSTDDATSDDSDENADLLHEMSQTLESLLREDATVSHSIERPKMLHITRTYTDPQGQTYQREEFVRNNDAVIQAYIKIRRNKTDKFIKAYYALDDHEREKLKRERRRLQEQLRRVKRNEARYHQHEKQQMLLQIQQENLALIKSAQACQPLSSSPVTLHRSTSVLSNLQLSLSDDDDDDDNGSPSTLNF